MREIEIIVNEDVEIVSVNDFFTFSVKYHNLSSTADTIHESEKLIVRWSTTGIWLIGDNELYIKEERDWRDISKELSFFLEWQNPDSIHYPISLKMLFYAIVDSLKHDRWKSFGTYQEHSIRISEIAQHYSKKAKEEEQKYIQEELDKVILEDLKRDFINRVKKKLEPTPEERALRGFAAMDRLDSLKPKGPTVSDPRQAAIDRREKDEKATVDLDLSNPLDRSKIAAKKWGQLTEAEKDTIRPMFEGMEDKDIQEYWDGTDSLQREIAIQCK